MPGTDLLGGPPATLLSGSPEASAALEAGTDPAEVAAAHPADSAAWAALADAAWSRDSVIESYAYARTGYHRGLDALRRHGWKGFGPVPWAHTPNRGFLRALFALGRAATAINETEEARRVSEFLTECDPEVARQLA